MYFITYLVLSVLLLQQTASSYTIKFCNPVSTHTVSVTPSISDIGLFLVSPNYPKNYTITEGCSVVLNFTVHQSFGVDITENVSSCDSPLPYQEATFNFNSAVILSCTLSTAGTFTRVHQITFQNSSNSDIVLIRLNEGAGDGFKLSVAILAQYSSTFPATTPTRAHQVTTNGPFITTTQWTFSDLMMNSRDVTSAWTSTSDASLFFSNISKISMGVGAGVLVLIGVIVAVVSVIKRNSERCFPPMGWSTIPDSSISSAPPIYINLPANSLTVAAASIGRQVHRYSDIEIHTGQYENIRDNYVLSNERNGATQEGEYTELQLYTDIDHTYAALG